MIECQSGSVTRTYGNQPSPLDKARQNSKRLDQVLTDMGVGLRRTYLLVRLRQETDEGLEEALASSSHELTALEPNQLRAHVNRLANAVT